MNKTYWLTILKIAPKGIKNCKQFFESQNPLHWRKHFREPSKLIDFFSNREIKVEILLNQKYGFVIRNGRTRIQRYHQWDKREEAEWLAIKWAFLLLEEKFEEVNEYHQTGNFGRSSKKKTNENKKPFHER